MITAFGTPPCYFTDAMKASLITYYLGCWLDGAVSCCRPSRGVDDCLGTLMIGLSTWTFL
ncbi:hypothetical protein BDW42DRAFT_165500 [Aspergillus taichungensis]|uniref:Uncharacterized protein n=1 Tax=Aspergillus taichungensis TaxID=482145 RepID=A0A2J5HZS6_9EURO|nr:hypothetical protein BDW42DRAFT_165500 [Aspergillus taichungensis]